MIKRSRRLVAFLFAALLVARAAAARELRIRNFESLITVNTDGTIDVSETIAVQFMGEWHGIYRTIPVEYATSAGLNYSLFVTDVLATDESGTRLKIETSRQGRNEQFKIYVPDAVDASHEVTLNYRVTDALRFFPDHDELYWNVTGNSWDVPRQAVSAEIELPPGVTGIRDLGFTGAYGSKAQDADITVNSNRVLIRATNPLRFHEGLTAVIGWDKGFVHEPTSFELFLLYLRSDWI